MESRGYKIVDPYATYFVTFTVVGWVDLFTRKACKKIVVDSLKYCQENKGLILYAYVIMESHIHLIVAANESTSGLSGIIRDYKRATSKQILNWIHKDNKRESRRDWLDIIFKYYGKYNTNNQVYQVWKQNNRPKVCLQPAFTLQKLNYIHKNPVVSGIVDNPCDFKYSSARNYAGWDNVVLNVNVLDFGPRVGHVKVI